MTTFTDPADAAAQLADAMRAIGQAASGPFEVEVRVRVVTAASMVRERQERLRTEQIRQDALQRYRERTERLGSAERGRPGLGFGA